MRRRADDLPLDLEARFSSGLEGRYDLIRPLDAGGMSTVFLARDVKHERLVAIKVLRPDLAQGLGTDRFLREIRIEASLDHPNIVPVFDSGELDGLPFFVMPFIEGESLRARLAREPQLPLEEAVQIALDVASALAAAHERGILHRDIKPGNILLGAGRAQVMDFGVARALDRAASGNRTATGIAVGTPAYMSPEQGIGDNPVDFRSDQYSLACVVHEMIAGEPVFPTRSGRAVIFQHAAKEPVGVRKFRPRVPEEVEAVILKGLAKNPADRFVTVQDFADALYSAALGEPLASGSGSRPSSRRRMRTGRGTSTGGIRQADDRLLRGLHGALARHPRGVVNTVLLVATVAVVGTLYLAISVLRPSPVRWEGGPPTSATVLPFALPGSSSDEERLAVDLSDRLVYELNRWDSIRAVGQGSLAGLLFDLGHRESVFRGVGPALDAARSVESQALASVVVRIRGDSASAELTLFDAGTGRMVGSPITAHAAVGDLEGLTAPLAFAVLGLEREQGEEAGLRSGTVNSAALVEEWEGMKAFKEAALDRAEAHFRRAVELDDSFAQAQTHLALTLYLRTWWERASEDVYAEIQRLSTQAMGDLSSLSDRDARHVRAFYAFQTGDYEQSRVLYDSLVVTDGTDLLAWLMVGAVEQEDPWLATNPDGELAPRGDPDRALRAFNETLRLRPTFEPGYLHVALLSETLGHAVWAGACQAFWPEDGEAVLPWRVPEVSGETGRFCLANTDRLEWVPYDEWSAMDREVLAEGSERLFRTSLGLLERWAAYSDSTPGPRWEMARALLQERKRSSPDDPARSSGMAEEALGHAEAALALETDTTAQDLDFLANLHLASGDLAGAVILAEEALTLYREATPDGEPLDAGPNSLANPFLATGDLDSALEIVSGYRGTIYVPVPGDEGVLSLAGTEPIRFRLRVLAASGVTGPSIQDELAAAERRWDAEGYSREQRDLILASWTQHLAILLAQDPELRRIWSDGVETEEPLWALIREPPQDPGERGRAMDDAFRDLGYRTRHADHAFALGVLAAEQGDHERAVRYLSRLDSIPYVAMGLDSGWGLRRLSYQLRAEEFSALGRPRDARRMRELFLEASPGG